MTWSFPIGRLLGSELRVHVTFFLLLAWIGAAAWAAEGAASALVNVAFILALFACVVAHEFGHAVMARRYGIQTPDITLLPIGGLARLERMPERPGQEIAVALAGPAVNVAIWAVLVAGFGAGIGAGEIERLEDPAAGFLPRLAAVNLILVVFNMIPAFPMDGGRVLRALLSIRYGRVRATRLAARTGQALAFVFGFLGLLSGNPLLVLVALFVFMAASAESTDVALRDSTAGLPARAAMITTYERVAPDDTMGTAGAALLRTTQAELPVIDADGRLAGLLTRRAILAAASEGRPMGLVSGAMLTDVPQVGLSAPLAQALDLLNGGGAPAVAVTDAAGHFLGYVTRENLGELMVIAGGRASAR